MSAVITNSIYEFDRYSNVMDFIKPAIDEGYPIAINPIKDECNPNFTRYAVAIGSKDTEFKIMVSEKKDKE